MLLRIFLTQAACALCVDVGSFSDPPEIPGLAHFLEHMVFMGSEKYPQVSISNILTKKQIFNIQPSCVTRNGIYRKMISTHLLKKEAARTMPPLNVK